MKDDLLSLASQNATKMIESLKGFSSSVRKGANGVASSWRSDAWVNEASGMGTTRDKTTFGSILPDYWLTDQEKSSLYHHDDMAARMIDVVPQEMLREGFSIDLGDPDSNDAITSKVEDLNLATALEDGVRWGRLYGGAAILIGCDDGRNAALPLKPERARDITFLLALDKRLLWPQKRYTDRESPRFGEPETYLLTSGAQGAEFAEVHESRLILCPGAPTGIRERQYLGGWDASFLQRAYDTLRQFNTGWKAVEIMMTDGNQPIFKMTGLAEILRAPGGGGEILRERLKAMDLYRSVIRALVLDADGKESFERQTISFDSIPQTLDKFMLRLAATVEVPVTILMGQSPAGMNATGESDFRWFYDRIRSRQKAILVPRIRRLVGIWLATQAGRDAARKANPREVTVKFPALWTETPLIQAQRRQAIITGDASLITTDQITADEVAVQRMRPDGYERELVFEDAAIKAREEAIKADYAARTVPEITDEDIATNETEGLETEGDGTELPTPKIALAPTDLATIITVNEGRASAGLPPLAGPDGELSITEFKAKKASVIADAAKAAMGEDPNDPAPAPAATFGGAPPFGGKPAAPEPAGDGGPDDDDEEEAAPNTNLPAFLEGEPDTDDEDRIDAAKLPRTFSLQRDVDETGVSGTGVVAHGTLYPNGKCTLCWATKTSSITMFDSIKEVETVHGHGGLTRIVWHDERADGGDFDESKVSRDEKGRFGSGGGGGVLSDTEGNE